MIVFKARGLGFPGRIPAAARGAEGGIRSSVPALPRSASRRSHGDGIGATRATALSLVHIRNTTISTDNNRVRRHLRMTTIVHPELEGLERYKFGWADSDV